MSTGTNGTSPGTTSSAVPSAPDPNAIIRPSMTSLMIGHTFLTLLLPLLIALFYFSTSQSRRRPIFILNVAVIIFAFTAGVLIDALAIHSILSPQNPWSPSISIAIGLIGVFQSIFVDLVLLVRLITVHPLGHLGPARFATLTFLPILLKIARLINMFIFTKVLVDAARGPLGAENTAVVWATAPYLKIEWSAQMVDNTYASFAFLWTIRDRGDRQGVTSDIHPSRVTFSQRMHTLSRIALSNFIIPTLFSIVQLVVVYRNVDVVTVNDIVLVNSMLAVFGVVFATVWAGNISRREAENDGRWGDASPTDDASPAVARKPHPHPHARAFAFPGLGSWRVASIPPTRTIGSIGYTSPPTEGTGLSARRGTDPEKGAFEVRVLLGSTTGVRAGSPTVPSF